MRASNLDLPPSNSDAPIHQHAAMMVLALVVLVARISPPPQGGILGMQVSRPPGLRTSGALTDGHLVDPLRGPGPLVTGRLAAVFLEYYKSLLFQIGVWGRFGRR